MQYSGAPPTFVPRAPRSSAIKIVRPPAEGEKKPAEATPNRPLSSASQQRGRADTFTSSSSTGSDSLSDPLGNQLCREYVLNGTCTKLDCDFRHPADYSTPGPPSITSNPASPSLAAAVASAPVFVPRNTLSPPSTAGNGSQPSFTPSFFPTSQSDPFAYGITKQPHETSEDPVMLLSQSMQSFNPYDTTSNDGSMMPWYSNSDSFENGHESYASAGGYFPPFAPAHLQQPLDYHLYSQPLPESLSHTYFMSDTLREDLQKRSEATRSVPPGMNVGLPDELQGYHSLVALEFTPHNQERRRFGNWFSTVYRAVSEKDGVTYVLRRIEGYHMMQQSGLQPIDQWSRVRHPNIVAVQEGFTTRAFGDNSLVVAYAYHPNSQTLADLYLKNPVSSSVSTPTAGTPPPMTSGGRFKALKPNQSQIGAFNQPRYSHRVPERTLWSYVVQIANAMKAVHDAGMAVRVLDASKILVTGKNRARLSACGIIDVLMHDVHPSPDTTMLQQEDLVAFGRLIIMLCCANPHAVNNLPKAIEIIGRHYTTDVKNVVLFLLSKPSQLKSISQLFDMLGSRLLTEMDEMQNAVDRLECELMSELENGRLVRLLAKFGFINERPEFARDARWSETGDRYVIKLFRDYVFHQVDANKNPITSLAHVMTCLNKLDAGSDERVLLIARDDQSCIVATYKEIKAVVEAAFRELVTAGAQS